MKTVIARSTMAGKLILTLSLATLAAAARADRPYRPSDRQVRELVRRIDDRAGEFRKHLDAALDRSPLSGSQREENIRVFARDFKDAAHRLREHPDEGRRSSADVGDILDRASAIDRFMQRQQLDERSEGDWTLLSADLSELARVYGVRWGYSRGPGHPGDEDIAALLGRLRDRTDEFRRSLGGELDRMRLAGTRREDEIDRDLKDFTTATDRLRDRFDEQRASPDDVRGVLRRAQTIDHFVRRWQLDGRAERTWNALRSELEQLAAYYRVRFRWEV